MSEKKEKVTVKGKAKVSVRPEKEETRGEIAPWHPPEYMREMDI